MPPIAGQLPGRVHQQRGHAPAAEWPGHGDLVNQQNAAAAESGIIALPHDRGVTDDIMTVRGDKACALRFCVTGQITPCPGLASTDPLDERPDG
jgi:hypothetical protein